MSFILNFVSGDSKNGGWKREDIMSCNHYSVYSHPDGRKTVTVYPTPTLVGGVDFTIMSDVEAYFHEFQPTAAVEPIQSNEMSYYHRCYVQNMEGKTINNIISRHGRLVDGTAIRTLHPDIPRDEFINCLVKLGYSLPDAVKVWELEFGPKE